MPKKIKPPEALLNTDELEVIEHLVDAWNAWVALEVLHPDANADFSRAIHAAQYLVMARPVQRQFNTLPNEN